jgi:hypothetical protein
VGGVPALNAPPPPPGVACQKKLTRQGGETHKGGSLDVCTGYGFFDREG